jgi:hypothetical protein
MGKGNPRPITRMAPKKETKPAEQIISATEDTEKIKIAEEKLKVKS